MQGRRQLGETTETALILYEPESLSYEEYVEIGRLLGNANRRLQWVIGDWLNLVEDIYPDRYSQAVEATGLAPQTLANRASICRHVPPARRRVGVPFAVHAEVAYLEPKERDRWLDQAQSGDWTREILREHMREERSVANPQEPQTVLVSVALARPAHTCPACGHSWEEDE